MSHKLPAKASRRDFLKVSTASLIGLSVGAMFPGGWLANNVYAIPASEGYLLVDMKKCQGCNTCMVVCSLAHEGKQNLSLSRIQVQQNPFKPWPNDIRIDQCRQCTYPPCIESCPTNALHADEENGGVRLISEGKCIGCQRCMEACPYETTSTTWNHIDRHMQKCDLCVNTPFWNEQGGPGGSQACVKVCPLDAIKFTSDVPMQKGDVGYKINLRGKTWEQLGYSRYTN